MPEDDLKTENKPKVEAWKIDDWMFDPHLFELRHHQQVVKLEPRVSEVLEYLARKAGQIISKEELLDNVWSGRVVGNESVSNAINKLRRAFSDNRSNPKILETIPKSGYRLIAVICPIAVTSPDDPVKENQSSSRNNLAWLSMGIAVMLLASLLYVGYSYTPRKEISADKAETRYSIIVIPFRNLGAGEEQEYFADGMTEDLITDLSRVSGLITFGRNTSFAHKDMNIDPQELGNKLDVSHILEGSIRKSDQSLRINARLIDAKNGQQLWSERYDRKLSDIFQVQDDLVQNIVGALSIRLTPPGLAALQKQDTDNFNAYDLLLQAQKLMNERSSDTNARAQELLRQVIGIDPTYSRPYGVLSVALTAAANAAWAVNPQKNREEALYLATEAVRLNPHSHLAHWALAFTRLYRKEVDQAEQAVKKALEIAPAYADGISFLSMISNFQGYPQKSLALIDKAKKLNPYYTWDYLYNEGWAFYLLDNYQAAVPLLREAISRHPTARQPRMILAAIYAAQGKPDEASWEIEQLKSVYPDISLAFLDREFPMTNKQLKARLISHLKMSGFQ